MAAGADGVPAADGGLDHGQGHQHDLPGDAPHEHQRQVSAADVYRRGDSRGEQNGGLVGWECSSHAGHPQLRASGRGHAFGIQDEAFHSSDGVEE